MHQLKENFSTLPTREKRNSQSKTNAGETRENVVKMSGIHKRLACIQKNILPWQYKVLLLWSLKSCTSRLDDMY